MKDKDFGDLPRDLKSIIAANGEAMEKFYGLPPEERERILDSVSETNKRLNRYKDTNFQNEKTNAKSAERL